MKAIVLFFAGLLTLSAHAQPAADRAAVEQAVFNYVDAFYQADTSKALESVARDIAKRGYMLRDGKYVEAKMSFEQLVSLAKRWKGNRQFGPETPRKVTVLDLLDQTASAKLEAQWGVDYLHLARIDGRWQIVNVLWQVYPAR